MTEFIRAYPEAIQMIMGGLLLFIVFLYKQNERKSVRLVTQKIDELCDAIASLIKKDVLKERSISSLHARMDASDARCVERYKIIEHIGNTQDEAIKEFHRSQRKADA